jgi:hypothetical protein
VGVATGPNTSVNAPLPVDEIPWRNTKLVSSTVRLGLALAIAAVYALHQDVWFWRDARPLVFGFLPIGLAYHGAYCLAVALLMWLLTRLAWPSHLEDREAR